MKIFFNILDEERKEVFKKLSNFKEFGYLAGGTALALQLGHRISFDFDIFCNKEISGQILNKLRKEFKIEKILINNSDELTFIAKGDIKITFLYYPFVFKGELIKIKAGIDLLSIKNIAIAKAYALNRRNSFRDYVDLYFILKKKKITLDEINKNAEKVFGELFSRKLFLSQLLYTDDIRKEELENTFIRGKDNPNLIEIKKYFKKLIIQLTK